MSDIAFAQLEKQVETLPMFQVIILKEKLDKRIQSEQSGRSADSFVFDSLVRHTDRADRTDEYIKEFRNNDRF